MTPLHKVKVILKEISFNCGSAGFKTQFDVHVFDDYMATVV